jgi:hypothetical protein
MGNYPMYPPPDNQPNPGSANGRYRRRHPDPRDASQYPEPWDGPEQPRGSSQNEPYPGAWESDSDGSSWYSANPRQQDAQPYPGEARNLRQPHDARAPRPRELDPPRYSGDPRPQGAQTYPREAREVRQPYASETREQRQLYPGDARDLRQPYPGDARDLRQPYPGEARDPRQSPDAWAPRSRELDNPTRWQSSAAPPERRQSEYRRPTDDRRPPQPADSATAEASRLSVPWVFTVVAFTVLGLSLIQIADLKAFHGGNFSSNVYLFFVGIILVFAPLSMRILMRKTAGVERFALVILLGIAFYVIKIQTAPSGFQMNDEFIHLRNTENILGNGHLFQYNPLLPTASYYQGLAAITATLVNLTGLSTFVSGLIIIGAARVLISASFYYVAEKVTGSSRGAGMASLVYATNCAFLFWSAQFAYEDLALPLAFFVVWWITRTRGIQARRAAQAITVIAIVAVTVTHHISAFALCGILVLLYIAERVLGYSKEERRYVGIFAALTGVLSAFWFFVVAKPAASYLLGQNFGPAIQQAMSALNGGGGQRQLYGGATSAPKWYEYVGFVAILIIMGALLPAAIRAWRILRTRGFNRSLAETKRPRAAIAVATLLAIMFPLTLLPRLTADGGAISGRTSEYIFTAIGCAMGLLVTDTALGSQRARSLVPGRGMGTLLLTVALSLMLVGQVTIGTSFFTVLTDPAEGFGAYIQPYMVNAATWSLQHLGPDQIFATDTFNELPLGTYGEEDPVNPNVIYPMFFSPSMDSLTVGTIKANHIHYVLLDWTMTEELPVRPGGSYYSALEPDASLNGKPLPKAYFAKFGTYTCSRLVYHSGEIQIYDVSQIANGSCVPKVIHSVPSKASSAKKSKTTKAAS